MNIIASVQIVVFICFLFKINYVKWNLKKKKTFLEMPSYNETKALLRNIKSCKSHTSRRQPTPGNRKLKQTGTVQVKMKNDRSRNLSLSSSYGTSKAGTK